MVRFAASKTDHVLVERKESKNGTETEKILFGPWSKSERERMRVNETSQSE